MVRDKYSAVWVSHSSISDFLKCPRAYFLRNVYKDPATGHKITVVTPPLSLGTAVHEVIESLAVLPVEERLKISTARCARVSYLTFDGKNDILANYELHDRLIESKHFSCTEHQAISMGNNNRFGNFWGWKQYRKFFDDEHHGRKLE